MLRSASVVLCSSLALATATTANAESDVLRASARLPKLPVLGERATSFVAESTRGKIRFPQDYRGQWVVLFSHPADFTPVCTSEFVAMSRIAEDLGELNTALIGLSVDSVASHKKWLTRIADKLSTVVPFPVVGDPEGEIAWSYGMIHPAATDEKTVRAVFVIDPKGTIRAMNYYPMEVGRNTAEILRTVIALQTTDAHSVLTPADWQPGDSVLVSPSKSDEDTKNTQCLDWFYCKRTLPEKSLQLPSKS